MMEFTQDQLKAIQLRSGDLLVSAAAGSGKTAVLVQRIIEMISKEKPVDMDRLLVVTFTDAAAGEMRRRIADALSALLEKEPDDQNLRRQWALLRKASISTVHSFCLKVIRTHFHLIDLDPSFRIGDIGEIRLLKSELIDGLFEEEYAKSDNEAFFNLVEAYGGGRTKGNASLDDSLQELVLRLYDFTRSNTRPSRWLRQTAEVFDAGIESIDESPWAKIMVEEIKLSLSAIQSAAQRGVQLAASARGPEKYIPTLLSDKAIVERMLKTEGFTAFYNALENLSFERLPTYRAKEEVDGELKERVKALRDKEIKKAFANIKTRIFFKPPECMMEDIHKLAPFVKALCRLTEDFGVLYAQAKKEKNIVDFNDLEHYCLEILADEQDMPTPAALALSERFDEILIDEYQDSNPVQELILSSISRNNRFMVGDVKQSIYKFRQARPEIFMEKYNSASPADGESEHSTSFKIDLSMNFRSRANLLHGVNFLFRQLMTPGLGGVIYDEKAALYPGAKFPGMLPGGDSFADDIELHLIDYRENEKSEASDYSDSVGNASIENEMLDEISRAEWEARIIAERIVRLTDPKDPFYITDHSVSGGLRPARYGDIVILMRSVSATAEVFLEELKKYNIPAFAGTSEGFFGSIEIITMISFLQIIDNPRQDIPLLTVLHSPVYGLDSGCLLEIRACKGKGAYYDCVIAYQEAFSSDEKLIPVLGKFMKDLTKWRKQAAVLPVNRLISVIYDDTSYYTYVGAMAGGKIRQANLDALHQRAIQYEATSYKGLFHFIKYLEKLQKAGGDTGDATALSENENLVKIMTVHKSKGLEFPIVMAAMLGKNFNMQDQRESLLMHDTGLGPVYIDLESRVRSNTLPRLALASLIRRENLAEELRVLYVALTRGKEKLIMTGCRRDLDKKMAEWGIGKTSGASSAPKVNVAEELPEWQLFGANNFLDWLMPALALYDKENDTPSFSFYFYDTSSDGERDNSSLGKGAFSKDAKALRMEWLKNLRENMSEGSAVREIYGDIDAKFSWRYPFALGLPAKVSISEIKRNYQLQMLSGHSSEVFPSEKLITQLAPDIFPVREGYAFEVRREEIVFSEPEFLSREKKLTGTQRGTAIHTVMEHLDWKLEARDADIRRLIGELKEKSLLTEEEAAAVPVDKILNFTRSTLAERMRHSPYLKRETPFVMGLSPYEVYFDERYREIDETILVHGIIDCYFQEGEELVLVDYKSDKLSGSPDEIERLKNKYALQLKLYKRAIEDAERRKVKECVLYLFGIDGAVLA